MLSSLEFKDAIIMLSAVDIKDANIMLSSVDIKDDIIMLSSVEINDVIMMLSSVDIKEYNVFSRGGGGMIWMLIDHDFVFKGMEQTADIRLKK